MNRPLLITIHMYLAAFFAPFVVLVSLTGGLYLLGEKGSVSRELVLETLRPMALTGELDDAATIKTAVQDLLLEAGVEGYDFEYVKVNGSTLYTRPTSRTHYVIKLGPVTQVSSAVPDLQAAMMELHKGHGPGAFKTFQKVFALGLLFIILSGLWLGLSAERLRNRTLAVTSLGGIAFLLVMLL